MRLATLSVANQHRPALVLGDQVLDLLAARPLSAAAALLPGSLLEILAGENAARQLLETVAAEAGRRSEAFTAAGALRPLAASKLSAPIPLPRTILAGGANYHEHLKEMNAAPTPTPFSFYKSVSSVVGPEDAIILPASNPDMVDWEGEFAAVIGRRCHEVSEADALGAVLGYTILNDVSARDWVAPAFAASGMMPTLVAWEHNILGKLFPTFCPIGPVIVTADEIGDPHRLAIETRLNGEVMQSSTTADLVFNVAKIISYYSRFLTFLPGDIISTGSPSGVGYGMNPKRFMRAGDTIEVRVEKIGTLRNRVVGSAERAAAGLAARPEPVA